MRPIDDRCGNPVFDAFRYYAYDWIGNRTQDSYLIAAGGTGRVDVNFTNNNAGQVTQMNSNLPGSTNDNGALVSNVVYEAAGPTSYTFGNGLTGFRAYDSSGRNSGEYLCRGTAAKNCTGATQLYGVEQGYLGPRVVGLADTGLGVNSTALAYDEFNWLTSTAYSPTNQAFTYGYDRYGNRWSQTVTAGSGPQPQFSFNANNNRIDQYAYDAAGNVTSDGIHSYAYDAEGNQVTVEAAARRRTPSTR